jgi:catechol 2,3-dioxygenase-like lactoylglutathione lyase family enzyme
MTTRDKNGDRIALGWLVPCLRAPKLDESLAFYEHIGFQLTGGKPANGWATLSAGSVELALMSFLPQTLLNFRGGPIAALADHFARAGLEPLTTSNESGSENIGYRPYDVSKYPSEYHCAPDGKVLDVSQSGDFSLRDPDGNSLYFDTVPVERQRFVNGERFASERTTSAKVKPPFHYEDSTFVLKVGSLGASAAYYQKLGFEPAAIHNDREQINLVRNAAVPARIGLIARGDSREYLRLDALQFDELFQVLSADSSLAASAPALDRSGRRALHLVDPAGNEIVVREATLADSSAH